MNCLERNYFSISNVLLVLVAVLSLYFLILPSSHMFGALNDSKKNLTEFFDETIDNLNYLEIKTNMPNSEERIESNSDLNLTEDDLIFEKLSEKSKEFKKEWNLFKTCFYITFAFMIINLLYDIITLITSCDCDNCECPQCLKCLCCYCYAIYLRVQIFTIKRQFDTSPLFVQFIFFLITIIFIAVYLFIQHDKIKNSCKEFFESINYIDFENNNVFFEDLDKYKKYVNTYFIILCIFEVIIIFYFILFCCSVKKNLQKRGENRAKEKEEQVKPFEK